MEQELVMRLRSAADQMPVRPLSVDDLVARGSRSLRVRRLALAGAVAALGALGVVVADRVATIGEGADLRPANERPPFPAAEASYSKIKAETLRFSELVESGDARRSWNMLTSRAQESIGSFETWEARASRDAEAFFGWIPGSDTRLFVTPSILLERNDAYTVTAVAPTEDDGTGLLQTVPVLLAGDDVLFDVDLDQAVGLTPEAPVFMAGCAGGEGCNQPIDFRPAISDGMTLSVLLEPAGSVKDVMFSVGGDALIMGAELENVADDQIRAMTPLGHADAPRETILNVVIETDDGQVESYGYRVLYEQGT